MNLTTIWTVVEFENAKTGEKHKATLAGRYKRQEIVAKVKRLFGVKDVTLGTLYSTSDFKYLSTIKPTKRSGYRR